MDLAVGRIGAVSVRPDNNFDSIRILAALSVMATHSFPLSYQSHESELLFRASGGQTTAAAIAVYIFFIVSGYLITQSFDRSRSGIAFLMARALRLLPGLIVVLLCLAFIVGPVISAAPLHEYFASAQPYRFVISNLALLDVFGFIPISQELPGVFQDNPFPRTVNGSLWTLRIEAECYMLVLCLGLCGLLNRFVSLCLLMAGWIAMKFWFGGFRVEFISCFLAGASLYIWHVPLRGRVALVCLMLWLASFQLGGLRLVSASAGAYLVIYLAVSPEIRMPRLARWGDLSYGTYIWSFPVQQIASSALGSWTSWYWNLGISIPIVLLLALASWHFVEAPALRLKAKRRMEATYSA